MEYKSIWHQNVNIKTFPSLDKDISCDVVIVGGGLCGILTGYYLKEAGKKVVILEKEKIGQGKTGNSTAMIYYQHDILYTTLINKIGFKKAKEYLEANKNAIDEYEKLSHLFDFDFEKVSLFLYSSKNKEVIKEEEQNLIKLGEDVKFKETIELPIKIQSALEIKNQAQMNPLKLISELSNSLEIYENTLVDKVSNNTVRANKYSVKANKIIIASHFPFINRVGLYFAKMYQKSSYVIAFKSENKINGMYLNVDDSDFYYRTYKDYLIVGGNDKRTGEKGNTFSNIIEFSKNNLSMTRLDYMWSNQDCVSLDQMPYIGRYSRFYNNIYVATGFNLWGMTQAMISAKLLTDLILNKENKYKNLYSPHRGIIKLQLFDNLYHFVKYLFPLNGKRCTHLGCKLKFNFEENVWECPCHGTKYDIHGNVISNPAIKKLKKKH